MPRVSNADVRFLAESGDNDRVDGAFASDLAADLRDAREALRQIADTPPDSSDHCPWCGFWYEDRPSNHGPLCPVTIARRALEGA